MVHHSGLVVVRRTHDAAFPSVQLSFALVLKIIVHVAWVVIETLDGIVLVHDLHGFIAHGHARVIDF